MNRTDLFPWIENVSDLGAVATFGAPTSARFGVLARLYARVLSPNSAPGALLILNEWTAQQFLHLLPEHRINDVVYMDFQDFTSIVTMNLLGKDVGAPIERADLLKEALSAFWQSQGRGEWQQEFDEPFLSSVALLSLLNDSRRAGQLGPAILPALLRADPEWLGQLLEKELKSNVQYSWIYQFFVHRFFKMDKNTRSRVVDEFVNRSLFLGDQGAIATFNAAQPKHTFSSLFDQRKIVIISHDFSNSADCSLFFMTWALTWAKRALPMQTAGRSAFVAVEAIESFSAIDWGAFIARAEQSRIRLILSSLDDQCVTGAMWQTIMAGARSVALFPPAGSSPYLSPQMAGAELNGAFSESTPGGVFDRQKNEWSGFVPERLQPLETRGTHRERSLQLIRPTYTENAYSVSADVLGNQKSFMSAYGRKGLLGGLKNILRAVRED